MPASASRVRGVSLIEALVALAVVALGLATLVGLHGTLRHGGDVARQRAEAVRIAQEAIERWRAFSVIDAAEGRTAYADIATTAAATIGGEATNTIYTLVRTVADAALDASSPRMKSLVVDVTWRDRGGETQAVRLTTAVAGAPPELGGLLSIGAGQPWRWPQARHPAIPVEAVDEGATSRFAVPASDGDPPAWWLFDNRSGLITATCDASGTCTAVGALLLSGHVRFATGAAAPQAADAEAPPGPIGVAPAQVAAVRVAVDRTAPAADRVDCRVQARGDHLRYFCALPVAAVPGEPQRWSGRSRVAGLPLAADAFDARDDVFRVCRYTSERSDAAVPPMRNADHPRDYVDVDGPLTQQNFLVVRGGDGDRPFACPDDDPATPWAGGRTWPHQPDA